jgi:hypothetical protein
VQLTVERLDMRVNHALQVIEKSWRYTPARTAFLVAGLLLVLMQTSGFTEAVLDAPGALEGAASAPSTNVMQPATQPRAGGRAVLSEQAAGASATARTRAMRVASLAQGNASTAAYGAAAATGEATPMSSGDIALAAAARAAAGETLMGQGKPAPAPAPKPATVAADSSASAPDTAPGAKWVPRVTDTWQLQLSGALDTRPTADVFVVDLFDTPQAAIGQLKSQGKRVVCNFSAGSAETWRPDAQRFMAIDKGKQLDLSPSERWLDTRSVNVREIVKSRLDIAAARGCDGVDADNVDAHTNDSGFPLTEATQLDYNRFIALEARARGLVAGLRNDTEQIAALEPYFAFAINEQCHEVSNGGGSFECDAYTAFAAKGKPVFNVEYQTRYIVDAAARAALCAASRAANMRTVILPVALDGSFRYSCD